MRIFDCWSFFVVVLLPLITDPDHSIPRNPAIPLFLVLSLF